MTKALTNYDKTKISTAHVFLQYDQATMIHKYSLHYNSDWLYITFINRTYRINRKTGNVQWSDNDFETVHEANHNEAMTICDTSKVITNKPKKMRPGSYCPAQNVQHKILRFHRRMRFFPSPYQACFSAPGLKSAARLP